MTILRISRTYPNIKERTIGLQTYKVSKYSSFKSIIFSKQSSYRVLSLKKVKNHEIFYRELNLSKNYNIIDYSLAFITKIYANYLFYSVIVKTVNFKKIKLIHIHNLNFLLCGIWLKKKFNKKIFLSIGGTDILRLKNKFLFNFLIKNVDTIFSVSNDLKKKFLKLYPKTKCFYISNGVDLKYFSFNIKKKENILLAVGNIRWQKNYSLLIRTAEKVFIKNPEYKLLICGSFSDKNELNNIKELIYEKGLEKKIKLLGYQNIKKIRDFYYRSKLLVLSSVSEGLPKVILESMSCGTPVISTDVGDNKLILKRCGLVVKSNDSIKLAKSINKALNSKRLYSKLVKNCYKDRNRYDWKKISTNIHKYY